MPKQLSQAALRRLKSHHDRVEGAQVPIQAAEASYRALAENFETALRAACEDAGVDLPPVGTSANIHIDWNTGEVTWREQLAEHTNGQVQEAIV
jgi:hypothetical protein